MSKYTIELEFFADGDDSSEYQFDSLKELIEELESSAVSIKVLTITKDAT